MMAKTYIWFLKALGDMVSKEMLIYDKCVHFYMYGISELILFGLFYYRS